MFDNISQKHIIKALYCITNRAENIQNHMKNNWISASKRKDTDVSWMKIVGYYQMILRELMDFVT